ncbi:MAG: winged helix DNA-binding domain-containing protein [Chloroflexia bacterium]|nr:winged helix DNA-binding domain-containing protein [Chloroflexia bacterium]
MTSKSGHGVAAAAQLPWSGMLAWRMARQHLAARAPRDAMLDVVTDLCGVHAQLMSSAELTLWARVEGIQPDDVQAALWSERSLVKTWAMRGTLHLLRSRDFPRWVAAQSHRPSRAGDAAWLRYFGMTGVDIDAILAAIPAALSDGPLTRRELADAVGARTGNAELGDKVRESWGAVLKPAAFQGALCFGPDRDRNVTFVAPERWLPAMPEVNADDAMPQVIRDYLAVYGPATRDDLARWFGLRSPAQAGRLLAGLGDELVTVDVEGTAHHARAADIAGLAAAEPSGAVRLVPAFDQYVVTAPRAIDAVLPVEFRPRVYRPQGWLSPVLLVDGRMAGTWRHERKGNRLTVEITPFAPLPETIKHAAAEEAERLAAFLGGTLALSWSDT